MWEEDEGRAPISPARVAQYEGCCVIVLDAEIRKKIYFHIHLMLSGFVNI
jgi:hypothetical protein